MKKWTTLIGQCFGLGDRQFAGHPSDMETAFELLVELRRRHVGWAEFECDLRRQLDLMPQLDTDCEVQRVRSFFRPWLLD